MEFQKMFQYYLWEFKWKISTQFEQVYLVFPRGWTYRITVFDFYLHTIILTISLFWLLWGTREKLNKNCILTAWNAFSETIRRFEIIYVAPERNDLPWSLRVDAAAIIPGKVTSPWRQHIQPGRTFIPTSK